MEIEDIDTDLGNRILKEYVSDGWKVVAEYGEDMIDKGIDFDSYTIEKDNESLKFEWDNWSEWKISGSTEILSGLKSKYIEHE